LKLEQAKRYNMNLEEWKAKARDKQMKISEMKVKTREEK
jgi:hypothetical protein